jgi:hypothetical protein
MWVAEAQITLGVVAAREGDLDEAVSYGRRALANGRKSLPSLAMVARDLTDVLGARYAGEPEADASTKCAQSSDPWTAPVPRRAAELRWTATSSIVGSTLETFRCTTSKKRRGA